MKDSFLMTKDADFSKLEPPLLEKPEKLSLSRRTAQEIERKILSGDYPPGSRLPAQRDLAESMGVSRTALREAISVLETRGLLHSLIGSGTYVTEAPETPTEAEEDTQIRISGRYSKLDFSRFRLAIEIAGIRLAAMKIKDAEIDRLTNNLQKFKEAVRLKRFEECAAIDAEFHLTILEAAGVELFTDLYRAFHQMLIDTIALLPAVQSRGWEAVVEHERVLEALKRRDPDEAVYYMQSHITRSAERLGFVLATEIL